MCVLYVGVQNAVDFFSCLHCDHEGLFMKCMPQSSLTCVNILGVDILGSHVTSDAICTRQVLQRTDLPYDTMNCYRTCLPIQQNASQELQCKACCVARKLCSQAVFMLKVIAARHYNTRMDKKEAKDRHATIPLK